MQIFNLILLVLTCVPLVYLVAVKPSQLDQKRLLGLLLGSLGLLPGLIMLGFLFSSTHDVIWLAHVTVSVFGAALAAIISIRIAAPLIQYDGLGRERTPADDLASRR